MASSPVRASATANAPPSAPHSRSGSAMTCCASPRHKGGIGHDAPGGPGRLSEPRASGTSSRNRNSNPPHAPAPIDRPPPLMGGGAEQARPSAMKNPVAGAPRGFRRASVRASDAGSARLGRAGRSRLRGHSRGQAHRPGEAGERHDGQQHASQHHTPPWFRTGGSVAPSRPTISQLGVIAAAPAASAQAPGPGRKHMIPTVRVQQAMARPVGLSLRRRIFSGGIGRHSPSMNAS